MDPFSALDEALDRALQEDPDKTAGVVTDALLRANIYALLVTCDDLHPEPLVSITVRPKDVTVEMVQGMVYSLLEQAGIKNPAPQAALAGQFVGRYVQNHLPKK
jgi:hypothetical protein